MTEYYAVIRDDDRYGPFESLHEPMALLHLASRDRGHTEEQSADFFFNQSSVEVVQNESMVNRALHHVRNRLGVVWQNT